MLTALPHARHHRFSYIKGNHPPNIPRLFLSSPESPTTFAPFVPRHSIALFLPPPPLFGATPIAASDNTATLLRYWPRANTRNWRVYFSEIRRAHLGYAYLRLSPANTATLFGATPIAASDNTATLLRYWPRANTRNWRVYFSEIRRALFDFYNVRFVSIYNDTLSIPNPLFVSPP